MISPILSSILGAGTAYASNAQLFVTSYAGTLTTLSLSVHNNSYQLTNTSVNLGCQPSPSWMTLDKASNNLFCIGEGATTANGSLTTYDINNGTLVQRAHSQTLGGPVNGALYGHANATRAIALAHYGPLGGVSSYQISKALTLTPVQNITFPAPSPPGPVNASQSASHAHEIVVDPTGDFVVVPDLGADLVHVFSYNDSTGALQATSNPLKVKPSTGPRHAAFSKQGNSTFLYVVGELGATLTGFSVDYDTSGMSFKQIYESDTMGGAPSKQKVAPAEIRVAPCNGYLIVSNRNDSSFTLPNLYANNSTNIPSDSLATYAIQRNGSLSFTQLWPAGGSFARSIDINAKGDMIAVGLQNDGRVVVLDRNVSTGLLGGPLAAYETPTTGQVSSVKWNTHVQLQEPAGLRGKKHT